MVLGGAIGVLAAAFVGAFLARKALAPIDRITQTASEIARGGDLQRRITKPGPPDEVGRLTETFNVMLDRLEGMFNAQQRFTADISHELRTPLTTIRGNVDLVQRMGGADQASIDAIRSETDRMIRLVGDLLLLAQADAGLPIRRAPVAIDQPGRRGGAAGASDLGRRESVAAQRSASRCAWMAIPIGCGNCC
jgi:signal transduction histidine kinase